MNSSPNSALAPRWAAPRRSRDCCALGLVSVVRPPGAIREVSLPPSKACRNRRNSQSLTGQSQLRKTSTRRSGRGWIPPALLNPQVIRPAHVLAAENRMERARSPRPAVRRTDPCGNPGRTLTFLLAYVKRAGLCGRTSRAACSLCAGEAPHIQRLTVNETNPFVRDLARAIEAWLGSQRPISLAQVP